MIAILNLQKSLFVPHLQFHALFMLYTTLVINKN